MKVKIDLSREYGIVLEGGGARGAYQIGAWKALKEAGVKIKGVAGASVGSLNGAFICMDDLEKAESVWETIAYSKVMDVDDTMIENIKNLDMKTLNLGDLIAEARRIYQDKGFDVAPLKKMLAENVDEEKIRSSPCEFYATTFSVSDKKELNVDVKQAPEGAIADVLLASAYFPAFKNEKLGGKTYMDGGSVNNVPVDVLVEKGYKDIIILRIYGIGVDRTWLCDIPDDVTVHKIAPTRNLGGILEFDCRRTKKNMRLGYFDAKRMLYGLAGNKYYFDMPYTEAYYFDKMMSELELFKLYVKPGLAERDFEKLEGYRVYTEKIFPAMAKKWKLSAGWDYRDLYAAFLEECAKKLKLEPFRIYTSEEVMETAQKVLGSAELRLPSIE